MNRSQQLAEFLRARRARIAPEDVGIFNGDRRRVPGLRREEVAMLTGLSTDYVTRLEQGRGHRPSEQVLEALARALRLDADATAYLFVLGRAGPSVARPARDERVAPSLQRLLDGWSTTPAIVHGRWLDVLASNALARALTPLSEPGTNMLRAVLLDPHARGIYADPEAASSDVVAYLRANVAGDDEDPELRRLLLELSQESEEFCRLWAQHDVQTALAGTALVIHPVVGEMLMHYQTFAVEGADRQTLMVVHTTPGTSDERALTRLARATAAEQMDRSEPRRLATID